MATEFMVKLPDRPGQLADGDLRRLGHRQARDRDLLDRRRSAAGRPIYEDRWRSAIQRSRERMMNINSVRVYLLAVLGMPLGGCSCYFRASGTLITPDGERLLERERVAAVVEAAVKPFGFSSGKVIPYKNQDLIDYELGGGGGFSRDRLTVMLEPSALRIGLKDNIRSDESELARRVLEAIRTQIADSLGARIEFRPLNKCQLEWP